MLIFRLFAHKKIKKCIFTVYSKYLLGIIRHLGPQVLPTGVHTSLFNVFNVVPQFSTKNETMQ